MKPDLKSNNGFAGMRLTGLLAGIGIAAIAIFSKNTVESALSLAREIHKEGFSTTTSAKVSTSEISFQTTSVPLPPKFWQDATPAISAPQLFEEAPISPPLIVTSLHQKPSRNPEIAVPSDLPQPPPNTPAPTPTATPVPKPEFDVKALKKALHENLSSVFTGDLPYILLKSGDRLYAGSKLTEGVTLEAISPTAILCTTPTGILKIESQPDGTAIEPDAESKSPLPLDKPAEPTASSEANSL